MSVTEIAIKRPSLIVVFFATITILGVAAYQQLKYELLPDFAPPFLTAVTVYPGAAPGEVETSVSKKIEEAVSSMENIINVRSISQENISIVMMEMSQGANIDRALQDAQRKINAVQSELPDDAKATTLNKFALDEIPVLRLGATSNIESTEFYQLLDDNIRSQFAQVEGVGQVNLVGGDQREIRIAVDPHKLKAYNLSILQVVETFRTANLDVPSGQVDGNEGRYSLRVAGKFNNVEGMKDLIVGQNFQTGSPIRLGEVAEILDGPKEVTTINRTDGKTSIGVEIRKQSDANAVAVVNALKVKIKDLEEQFAAQDLKFTIATDGSVFTLDAADAVVHDLFLAVILVALVMLVFLHTLRNAFIVMVAIPASIVSVFLFMYILDFSLNIMTLLGLSLVIGILVDDSIVVLENIYRHLEMGKEKRQAALDGRNEIGFTAISITLVDVVVFVPLSLVSGLIGGILREFALVVVLSTLMSLVVSFTITPLLASRMGKHVKLEGKHIGGKLLLLFEYAFDAIKNRYVGIIRWSLRRWYTKAAVLFFAFAALVASFALVGAGFIGGEFIAEGDRGEFVVKVEAEPTTPVLKTNEYAQQVEDYLRKRKDVVRVFSYVGTASTAMGSSNAENNVAEMQVKLVPLAERSKRTEDVAEEVKNDLLHIPGVKITSKPVSIMGTADQAPIQLIISSPEREVLAKASDDAIKMLRDIPGVTDVESSLDKAKPQLEVTMDREKMALLGLNVASVGATLRAAFAGNDDSKYRDGDYEYDIRVVFNDFDRGRIEDLKKLTVLNNKGQLVELQQFASVIQDEAPLKLERRNRIPSVIIDANALGRPVGTIGEEFKAKLKESGGLPKGVTIAYESQLRNQADAFSSLGYAMLAAVVFIYLIMVALYDSYVYPFVVMFSLPFAVIGALLALALTMNTLNIMSILGFIMLMGLVAKNAILLVDFTNHRRMEGLSTFDALVEAGQERLRPIVMTTMAMVIGMIPIAVAKGAGAEWKNGLAWALIGGLLSSMLLTLVVVPVVYSIVDKLRILTNRLFGHVGKTERIQQRSSDYPDFPDYTPPSNGGYAVHETATAYERV